MSNFMNSDDPFTALLVGILIHNPYVNVPGIGHVTREIAIHRYGINFQDGLNTFSRLSVAEQSYLITYFQK